MSSTSYQAKSFISISDPEMKAFKELKHKIEKAYYI